jgi:hypothetical protein
MGMSRTTKSKRKTSQTKGRSQASDTKLETIWLEGERIYNPPGFTDQVLEYLTKNNVKLEPGAGIYRAIVNSKQLIDISKMLPPEQLEERQNESPTFKDFLEVAMKEPRALFEIYIVPKWRFDERVTVDGVHLPNDPELVDLLLSRALNKPDEKVFYNKNNTQYVYLWWD